MSFGWWTILDTHGKLLSVKNPAALQFLTQTGAPGTYHLPFVWGVSHISKHVWQTPNVFAYFFLY
jgi:hypothetical protein